jgi:hypothetical protein
MRNGIVGRSLKIWTGGALVCALVLAIAPARSAAAVVAVPLGTLYVADADAFPPGVPGGVMRVARSTGVRTTVSENNAPAGAPTFLGPDGIAVEADGDILVSGAFTGADLVRIDPGTGVRTTLSNGGFFGNTWGIAVEATGDILVVNNAAGGNIGVIRVDPASGAQTALSTNVAPAGGPSFVEPIGIDLADNGDIYVADATAFGGSGGVIKVDPVTGTRTLVSRNGFPAGGTNFVDPTGIAVESSGDLLVADQSAVAGGAILRVDGATGARTVLSQNLAPGGLTTFTEPWNLELSGGDVLVADTQAFGGTGGIIEVDTATGARSTVSRNTAPAGAPLFEEPYDLAVKPILLTRVFPRPRDFPPDLDVPPLGSGAGARGGTTFNYRLSDPARVTFTIHRRLPGRVVRGRCRAVTRQNRGRRRCVRHVRIGRFSHAGRRGANRRRFSGKIARRALQPGSYRAILLARNRAGYRSVPVSTDFRVVR